jgi:hypothetical protein
MNEILTAKPTNGNGKEELIRFPEAIKVAAKIISWTFHPIFIPVYVLIFLLQIQPHLFVGLSPLKQTFTVIQFGVMYAFFPVVTALLLKALGFIESIYMKTQKDRIIPYVICMIYYFWNWYTNKNLHAVNDIISISMAVFNASVFGFLANISMKVSMHAISVGVMTTFVALLALNDSVNLSLYLCIAVLISGAVCTSRLIVSDHTQKEIYYGFFIGIFCQMAAHYFVYS